MPVESHANRHPSRHQLRPTRLAEAEISPQVCVIFRNRFAIAGGVAKRAEIPEIILRQATSERLVRGPQPGRLRNTREVTAVSSCNRGLTLGSDRERRIDCGSAQVLWSVETSWSRGVCDDDVVHEASNPLDRANGFFRIRSFERLPYAAGQRHHSTVHMHVHTLRNRSDAGRAPSLRRRRSPRRSAGFQWLAWSFSCWGESTFCVVRISGSRCQMSVGPKRRSGRVSSESAGTAMSRARRAPRASWKYQPREASCISPLTCPGQHTRIDQRCEHGLACGLVDAEAAPGVAERERQTWRLEVTVLHPHDQGTYPAATRSHRGILQAIRESTFSVASKSRARVCFDRRPSHHWRAARWKPAPCAEKSPSSGEILRVHPLHERHFGGGLHGRPVAPYL
jgi:hypothetical protein